MRVFADLDELAAAKGEHLGTSDWFTVDQERIDRFAEATDDHQWIHVDPERAEDGPYGQTIAHGYLTLALAPVLKNQIFDIDDVRLKVNYGLNRVRFPAPVPSGSRIRGSCELAEVKDLDDGGAEVVVNMTIEIEGQDRPACVLEQVSRIYP